jgi:hypothetical protein
MNQVIAIEVSNENWPQSYACINFLLDHGFRILWATHPFSALISPGQRRALDQGTFVITEVPCRGTIDWLEAAETRYGPQLLRLSSTEGLAGLSLQLINVALYGGGGSPFNHARIFAELGFRPVFVSPQEIRQGKLAGFDMLVVPGGGALAMKGQLDPLGEQGCQAVADFVRAGGMYVGACAGAFDAAIAPESFLATCPQQRTMQLVNVGIWNGADAEDGGLESPGVGVIRSQNRAPDHPVMTGMPEEFEITHYNGPFFDLRSGVVEGASDATGLAAVSGRTGDFTPSEYFLRISESSGAPADQPTLVDRASRAGCFNVVAGYNGLGRVVLFGSHPEFGLNLIGDIWNTSGRMLANAAFWQAGHKGGHLRLSPKDQPGTPVGFPMGAGLQSINNRLTRVNDLSGELKERPAGVQPTWLAEDMAMSTFGLTGGEIWHRNLTAFMDVSKDIAGTLDKVGDFVKQTPHILKDLQADGSEIALVLYESVENALVELDAAIYHWVPKEWKQDFGYEGILQMLDRVDTMLRQAQDAFQDSFEVSANPYQYLESSPYHLVAGSYLGALGVLSNVWHLLKTHEARYSDAVFKSNWALTKGRERS